MRCPICGTKNHEGVRFCAACGTLLAESDTVDMRAASGETGRRDEYYDGGDIYNVIDGSPDSDPVRRRPRTGEMHTGFMTVLAMILIISGLAVFLIFILPGRRSTADEPAAQTQKTEDSGLIIDAVTPAQEETDETAEKEETEETAVSYEEEEAPALTETEHDQEARPAVEEDGTRFPDSSRRYLSYGEITDLDLEQIQTCINDIFAREGYIFKDSRYLDHYRQFSWYVERIPADSFDMKTDLNEIEYANVELLASRRDELNQ